MKRGRGWRCAAGGDEEGAWVERAVEVEVEGVEEACGDARYRKGSPAPPRPRRETRVSPTSRRSALPVPVLSPTW